MPNSQALIDEIQTDRIVETEDFVDWLTAREPERSLIRVAAPASTVK